VKAPRDHLPHVGWREWVALPALGIPHIKAKIDTGARTSALHAFDIVAAGDGRVRFKVHPYQRDAATTLAAEARLVEERLIRSSSGHATRRPVIHAEVELLGQRRIIELTLISRDEMGFRMLLGRQAIRDWYVVDPGRSYLGGKPPRHLRKGKPK